MGRFLFSLEKVWQHRQRLVDLHSREVARADRRMADLARDLVALDTSIHRQEQTLATGEGHTLKARDLLAGYAWLEHLRRQRETLDQVMMQAARERDELRTRLTESWRDLEVLTRLRDKQEDDWKREEIRRERREMDEIGQVQAFGRGQANNSA